MPIKTGGVGAGVGVYYQGKNLGQRKVVVGIVWMSDTVNGSCDPNTSITLIGPLPTGGSEIEAVKEGGSFETMGGVV